MAKDSRKAAIEREVKKMLDEGKDLTRDKRPELPVLTGRLGFDIKAKERDDAYDEVIKEGSVVKRTAPAPGGKPKGRSDLQLETMVQIAAKFMSKGIHTDNNGAIGHLRLTASCGFGVTEEQAKWACAEARRRSPGLDHKEIVHHPDALIKPGVAVNEDPTEAVA